MSLTLLHRINIERNEARFYLIQVGASTVDRYAVLRIWGRISGAQRSMATPCDSLESAQALADKLARLRLRHGYQISEPPQREHLLH
jgi:predicted DNA-binding WGR domain protein